MEINIVITAAGSGQVRAVMYSTEAPHLEMAYKPDDDNLELSNVTISVESDAIRITGDDGDDSPTATKASSSPRTINQVTGDVAGSVNQYGNVTGSVTFHQ